MTARDANKLRIKHARQGFFENLSRKTTSFASWQALQRANNVAESELTQENYDAFITNEAIGYANNPISGFLYNTFDPDGVLAASQNLERAGANLIRKSRYAGRRTAFTHARAVGNLFTGANGEYKFEKADYGFMNIGEASAVAAALTNDLDIFEGAGNDPKELENASKRLQKLTKDYTQALAPLKDVFGTDVPAMIKAIEDLSGQKFSQVDPTQLKQMTQRVMAGVVAGNYDLAELTKMRTNISSALMQMNTPTLMDVGVLAQSQSILGQVHSGITPSFMSSERYTAQVADFAMRTATSGGAQYLNQAYAVWKTRNPTKSIEEFEAEYNSYRKQMDVDSAILAVAGKNTFYDIEDSAMRSQYLQEAYRFNVGASLAAQTQTDTLISRARDAAVISGRADSFDKAIDLVRKDVSLLNDIDGMTKRKDITEDVKAEILAIANGGYDINGVSLGGRLIAADAETKAQQRLKRQVKAMQFAEKFEGVIAGDFKELFSAIAQPNGSLKDVLKNRFKLEVQDEDDYKLLATALNISQDIYKGGRLNEEQREDLAKKLILNGPANALVMGLVEQYEKTPAGSSKSSEIASRIQLALNADETSLNRYFERVGDKEKAWESLTTVANNLRNTGVAEELISTEMADYLRASDFEATIIKNKQISADTASKFNALVQDAATGLQGALTYTDYKDLLTTFVKDNKISGEEEQALRNSINEVFNEDTSPQTIFTDIAGTMRDLCTHIDQLLGRMDKEHTGLRGSAAQFASDVVDTGFGTAEKGWKWISSWF